MRKRRNRVEVRLSDAEESKLHELMNGTGFNASQIIRSLIIGAEIKTRPPDIMPKVYRELSAIGNNINQIARVANHSQRVDNEDIKEIQAMFKNISKEVRNF